MFGHYMLVKQKGLSKPYRKDIPYSMVPANHKTMYRRMVYVLIKRYTMCSSCNAFCNCKCAKMQHNIYN